MSDCIFCDIIAGKLQAIKVYEDDSIMAFQDAYPASPIHILIVPKKHIPTFNDVSDDDHLLSDMGKVARRIARDIGVAEPGYRFFINVNRGGGQVVFHLHAHLIAGRDLGTFLINFAVAGSVLWRKIAGIFRGTGRALE